MCNHQWYQHTANVGLLEPDQQQLATTYLAGSSSFPQGECGGFHPVNFADCQNPGAMCPASQANPFIPPSGFSFNARPMNPMSIPLNEIPPISVLAGSLARGQNVAQLRTASAQRNLPQHARANSIKVTRGSAKITSPATVVSTRADIAIIPIPLLRDRSLVIEVQIARSYREEIWLELHTMISAHLAVHGLILPSDPSRSSGTGDNAPFTPSSYHDLDWALMEKKRTTNGFYIEWADIHGSSVTLERLLAGTKHGIPHPDDKPDRRVALIAICPRFSPIKLPLTRDLVQGDPCPCHDMPHCCAGFRLLLRYIKYRGRNKGSAPNPVSDTTTRIYFYSHTSSLSRKPTIHQIPAPSSSLTPAFNTMALSSISSNTPVEDDGAELYFPNIREILDEDHARQHPVIPNTIRSSQSGSNRPIAPSQSQSQSVPNSSSSYLSLTRPSPIAPSQSQSQSVPNSSSSHSSLTRPSSIAPSQSQSVSSSPYLGLTHPSPIAPSQSQSQSVPNSSSSYSSLTRPSPIAPSQLQLQSVPNSSSYLQLGSAHPVALLPEPSEPLLLEHGEWVEALSDARFEVRNMTIAIELHGESPQVLGRALLSYLQYIAEHPLGHYEWVKPAGVAEFTPFVVSDLTASFIPSFKVGQAVGDGVGRAVLIEAVRTMTSDAAFWRECRGYMQPVFLDDSTSNSSRKTTWMAYGTLCGLYLARLATGPLPVSPFLIMTALLSLFGPDSDQNFDYLGNIHPSVYGTDPRYVADIVLPMTELGNLTAYDPDLARELQPWIELQWNDPVPSDFSHPVRQFIIGVLDKNIIEVTSSRQSATSPSAHNAWLFQAFFKLVFGHSGSVLGLGEFVAFRQGLNVAVPTVGDVSDLGILQKGPEISLVKSMAEVIDRTDIPRFVLAMYNRRIVDAKAFFNKHISFPNLTNTPSTKGKNRADQPDPAVVQAKLRRFREEVFVRRLKRYLTEGRGHPLFPNLHETCMLSSEEVMAERHSSTLRATALLRALTDSDLIPAQAGWHINFAFQHDNVPANENWLFIHTCTANVDVRFTTELVKLITTEDIPKSSSIATVSRACSPSNDSPSSPMSAHSKSPEAEVALEDMDDAALLDNLRVLTQTGDEGRWEEMRSLVGLNAGGVEVTDPAACEDGFGESDFTNRSSTPLFGPSPLAVTSLQLSLPGTPNISEGPLNHPSGPLNISTNLQGTPNNRIGRTNSLGLVHNYDQSHREVPIHLEGGHISFRSSPPNLAEVIPQPPHHTAMVAPGYVNLDTSTILEALYPDQRAAYHAINKADYNSGYKQFLLIRKWREVLTLLELVPEDTQGTLVQGVLITPKAVKQWLSPTPSYGTFSNWRTNYARVRGAHQALAISAGLGLPRTTEENQLWEIVSRWDCEALLPPRSQIAPGSLDSVAAGTTAKAVSDMTATLQKKYPAYCTYRCNNCVLHANPSHFLVLMLHRRPCPVVCTVLAPPPTASSVVRLPLAVHRGHHGRRLLWMSWPSSAAVVRPPFTAVLVVALPSPCCRRPAVVVIVVRVVVAMWPLSSPCCPRRGPRRRPVVLVVRVVVALPPSSSSSRCRPRCRCRGLVVRASSWWSSSVASSAWSWSRRAVLVLAPPSASSSSSPSWLVWVVVAVGRVDDD
ncbi:hypothetical protein C8Q74DRAFT_1219405 [Fomes fomentarius]|nr:hypothetical protein C8Q74DRAFT_1219405 [Fomes fomentarius]